MTSYSNHYVVYSQNDLQVIIDSYGRQMWALVGELRSLIWIKIEILPYLNNKHHLFKFSLANKLNCCAVTLLDCLPYIPMFLRFEVAYLFDFFFCC